MSATTSEETAWRFDAFAVGPWGAARTRVPPMSANVAEFVAWANVGVVPADRRRSTIAPCAASSPTSTRAASPAPPSPARQRPSAHLRFLRRQGVLEARSRGTPPRPQGCQPSPACDRTEEANDLLDDMADAVDLATVEAEDGDDPVVVAVVLRDLAVLEVLYGAGLRVSECCGLRISDCDLGRLTGAGLVTVLGKGSKVRRVPIGAPAVDALTAWLDRLGGARHERLARRPGVPQPPRPCADPA